jgi:hypothetical protein
MSFTIFLSSVEDAVRPVLVVCFSDRQRGRRESSRIDIRSASSAELKKMVKDAICSGNYFEITSAELAHGNYQLPRLAHYDGALDMDSIGWLRNSVGMAPYMHFRPYLRHVFEATPGTGHQCKGNSVGSQRASSEGELGVLR